MIIPGLCVICSVSLTFQLLTRLWGGTVSTMWSSYHKAATPRRTTLMEVETASWWKMTRSPIQQCEYPKYLNTANITVNLNNYYNGIDDAQNYLRSPGKLTELSTSIRIYLLALHYMCCLRGRHVSEGFCISFLMYTWNKCCMFKKKNGDVQLSLVSLQTGYTLTRHADIASSSRMEAG